MNNQEQKEITLVWVVNTPTFGGLERFTVSLLKHLPAGFRQLLVTSRGSKLAGAAAEAGAAVRQVAFPRKMGRYRGLEIFNPWLISKVRRIIAAALFPHAEQPATTVVFQTFLEKLFGTPVARRYNLPVVWVEHGPLPGWFRENPLLRFLYRQRAALTQGVVAVSRQVADSLQPLHVENVTVINNAIPGDVAEESRAIGTKVRLGYFGRLEQVKGCDTLLDLAKLLPKKKFDLTVAGEGRYAPLLRKQAESDPESPLTVLPFQNDIKPLLDTTDVLLYLSRAPGEGLPLIVLEAMARGIPTICFPTGGLPTAVDNGYNGIVIEGSRSAAAVRDAIEAISLNGETYARFSRNALERVNKKFSFTWHLEKYRGLFERAAGSRRAYGVTYISGESELSHGGGVHTLEMANVLARKFSFVNLVVPAEFPVRGTLPELAPGVMVTRIPMKLFGKTFLPLGALFTTELLKRPAGTIIERYYCTGSLARILSFFSGAPYLLEVNHPHHLEMKERHGLPDWLLTRLARQCFNRAHRAITTTARIIPEPYRELVLELDWGVSLKQFDRVPAEQFGRSPKTVVFTGSLQPWHGTDILLAAMQLVAAQTPTIHFLLIGGSQRQQKQVTQRCKALGIPRKNYTVQAAVPCKQIPAMLKRGVVGVAPYQPTHHPAFATVGFYWTPFKILEYLATGLPVVTTDNAYLEKLIATNGYGLCAAPTPEALSKAILNLCQDSNLWHSCHTAIANSFGDRYSWEHFLTTVMVHL